MTKETYDDICKYYWIKIDTKESFKVSQATESGFIGNVITRLFIVGDKGNFDWVDPDELLENYTHERIKL